MSKPGGVQKMKACLFDLLKQKMAGFCLKKETGNSTTAPKPFLAMRFSENSQRYSNGKGEVPKGLPGLEKKRRKYTLRRA
uniref:Uncharacterized protein n=1 Tax=Cannabis sativa TaxID=3483 RepID=A0A803PFW3_CANSA